ncbi:DivIVA domain-containing protein [Paenibacillus sp. TRM 82003]|uniref:DivIVA domain-containing protein n=1 Tax=Kineococcus sp. TRM81007 TaxID=2925831 RepID=UPI001F5A526B|nr:DivIVA domain-containing protein [Kineococcus sp. TRM81007]MCI2238145.1 DivIVA domain-containing protein [Kineococcus sp. TRM81007]MCI3920529.1 DivIVA domain-containing protein [Paenibacillus sp. TRM 82003]
MSDQGTPRSMPQGAARGVAEDVAEDVTWDVGFGAAPLLQRGYDRGEVDAFLARVRSEVGRLAAERAALREEVQALRRSAPAAGGTATPVDPTDQAVGILAAAQQTADQYVADAESFSRMLATQAREQYENLLQQARDEADEIVRRAAARTGGDPGEPVDPGGAGSPAGAAVPAGGLTPEEVQEQVVYLQAFGRACRAQLRAYLEGLLEDVEAQWGKADPAALPEGARTSRNGGAPDGEPAVVDLTGDGAVPTRR